MQIRFFQLNTLQQSINMQLPNNLALLTEVLSKLPQQKIAQAISICLLGYIAYLAAQITWLMAPAGSTAVQNHISVSGKTRNQSSGTIDLNSLQALNLFGAYNEKPVEIVQETQADLDAPETTLNLMLSGVVASDDKTTAAAVIENNSKQETYGIGDTITGTRVVLENVLSDRVLIKQSGRLETLMLDGYKYEKVSSSNNAAFGNVVDRSSQKRLIESSSSSRVIDQRKNRQLVATVRDFKNTLAQNPGKIIDFLNISPKRVNGKIIGYRLSPGKKPDFFKSSGLKAGDVVVQMNGYDLTQPLEQVQALKALRQDTEVSLLIDRNGEMTEILFSVDN